MAGFEEEREREGGEAGAGREVKVERGGGRLVQEGPRGWFEGRSAGNETF